MTRKQIGAIFGAVVLAVAAPLLTLTLLQDREAEAVFGVFDSVPQTINNVSIDMDPLLPAPNPANGLIPGLETCKAVAIGGTIDIDVVIDEVDPADLMQGFQAELQYDDNSDGDNTATVSVFAVRGGLMILANAGSVLLPVSDPTPDAISPFIAAASDLGAKPASSEVGEGVVARITIQGVGPTPGISGLYLGGAKTMIIAAIGPLTNLSIPITNNIGSDIDGDTVNEVAQATVAVGDVNGDTVVDDTDCLGAPPPPPPVLYSTSDLGTVSHDITPNVSVAGLECSSSGLLVPPTYSPFGPCAARVAPAPPGPVPDATTFGPTDLGISGPGPFFDDLDALSLMEPVNTGPVDYDFSVDAAPGNLGNTVGLACGPAPNVNSEAAAWEAQGDIFNTGTLAPTGCNLQTADEAALGLIAPNPLWPPTAPLDEMNALTEISAAGPPPGPCTWGNGMMPSTCPAFSLTVSPSGGGGTLTGLFTPPIPPDAHLGMIAGEGSILVPPASPPIPPALPLACAVWNGGAGVPCIAVNAVHLGLPAAGGPIGTNDDLDALCWFDGNGNSLPDIPNSWIPGMGDYYIFSLTPGSPSVGGGTYSAADLLTPDPLAPGGPPLVLRTAGSLGLSWFDNVDGLICRDDDTDLDGAPDLLDNCPSTPNATQANADGDQWGDACDNCPATPTSWYVPVGDSDCDGFTDAAEAYVGTDPADPCPDDLTDDAWPVDMDMNKTANIIDVLKFKPYILTSVPPSPQRFDFDTDGDIDIIDILKYKPFILKSCT